MRFAAVVILRAGSVKSLVVAKKSVVSLREDQHAFAKALVVAGRFPSGSAALQVLLQQR